jgi:hypothetical protein
MAISALPTTSSSGCHWRLSWNLAGLQTRHVEQLVDLGAHA